MQNSLFCKFHSTQTKSLSCHHCNQRFSVFNFRHQCPQCNCQFCSQCITGTITSEQNKQRKICDICKRQLDCSWLGNTEYNETDNIKFSEISKTVFTLVLQMVGASCLPSAFIVRKVGLIPAIAIYILNIAYTYFFFYHFVDHCYFTQSATYKELAEKAWSKKISNILEIITLVFVYLVEVAYIIIAAMFIESFLLAVFNIQLGSYAMKGIVSIGCILPLGFLKSVNMLAKISIIAFSIIIVTAITVLTTFGIGFQSQQLCQTADGAPVEYGLPLFPNESVFTIVLYAIMYLPSLQGYFFCQTLVPTMMSELPGTYQHRRNVIQKSLVVSISISLVIYICTAFIGAFSLGAATSDNLLLSYKQCNWQYIDYLTLVYAVVMITSYALMLYPIRISVTKQLKIDPYTKKGYWTQVLIYIITLVTTMLIAMLFSKIACFLGFIESFAAPIFYILIPVYTYIKEPVLKFQAYLRKIKMSETGIQTHGGEIQSVPLVVPTEKNQDNIIPAIVTSNEMQKTVPKEDLLSSDVETEHGSAHQLDKIALTEPKISCERATFGITVAVLWVVVCCIGFVMNGIDVVKDGMSEK